MHFINHRILGVAGLIILNSFFGVNKLAARSAENMLKSEQARAITLNTDPKTLSDLLLNTDSAAVQKMAQLQDALAKNPRGGIMLKALIKNKIKIDLQDLGQDGNPGNLKGYVITLNINHSPEQLVSELFRNGRLIAMAYVIKKDYQPETGEDAAGDGKKASWPRTMTPGPK